MKIDNFDKFFEIDSSSPHSKWDRSVKQSKQFGAYLGL